jgi:hypothetical protein
MTARDLQKLFQKGDCLSLDTMRLYIDGKLDKTSTHAVEEHMVECALCTAAVDGLTPRRMAEVNKISGNIDKRLAVYMNTPPSIPFFRRFAGLLITLLILLGGTFSWWFFTRDSRADSVKISDSASRPSDSSSTVQNTIGIQAIADNQSEQPEKNHSSNEAGNVQPTLAPVNAKSFENLPATQPGKSDQAITVSPTLTNTSPSGASGNTNQTDGTNTRSAANPIQLLRIKKVVIYPPVTHSADAKRNESGGGQIGRSGGTNASFQLDEMPTFPGGDDALRNYIMNNFKPMNLDKSKLAKLSTGVLVVVNAKTGAISSAELSYSISPEADAELLRVIKAMPQWNPGKKRGEVDVMIGVTFE